MRANERADKGMAQCSMRSFHSHSIHCVAVVVVEAAAAAVVKNSHGFPFQEKLFSVNIEKALQRTMNRNGMKSTLARSFATLNYLLIRCAH